MAALAAHELRAIRESITQTQENPLAPASRAHLEDVLTRIEQVMNAIYVYE